MLSEDADQRAILADWARRLLITAPPGSGKTVTAILLAARDVDHTIVGPTQRVLILTFSLEARAQLEAYAKDLLSPEQRTQVEITNYHAWFWSKVRQFRSSLGLPHELELTTRQQHDDYVLRAMGRAGVAIDGNLVRDYGLVLEHAVDGCRPDRLPDPLPDADAVADELTRTHREGHLHYDDLAFYMWRLADESQTLRCLWRHKYPVIVLDEYQDSSAIQARIVERIAGDTGRVYAFADPLQMIYGWRDASPQRVDDFRARGVSHHTLKTLHRYRHRPALRAWMEGVREILLANGGTCPSPPDEVTVVGYDRTRKVRGEPYDIASRDLWQLDAAISEAFKDPQIRSIAVLHRKHTHLERVERHLSQHFFCKRVRTARDTAEWAREWVETYPIATSDQLKMEQLLQVALRVAPRNEDLHALRDRVYVQGIQVNRLGTRRRNLGTALNEALPLWTDLAGACASARAVARIAAAHEDEKLVAGDAAHVVRGVLRARDSLDDAAARELILNRLVQLRFTAEAHDPRGLYLLTCHEAKGKEFDMVILPYVSATIFNDADAESRQILYVSLTRTRHRLFVRVAEGDIPVHCQAMGLVPMS
jgi:superfamily I DNA/RNA helicase